MLSLLVNVLLMNLVFKENSLCVRVNGLFVDEFIFSGGIFMNDV